MTDDPKTPQQHKNDIYGVLGSDSGAPAIPAATVVLLRDVQTDEGIDVEVLMLKKNSKIAFGGMWVFPGGRIDEEDYPEGGDLETAARTAAAREAAEEAAVVTSADDFVWFAHWSPPPSTKRRFATWFFAARAGEEAVEIDGGEILEHSWIGPADAIERHSAGTIDLAPPTWVTLYHLAQYKPTAAILEALDEHPARVYETHIAQRQDGLRVAMWTGDAGYEDYDADAEGERHRLVLAPGGFRFEQT